MKMMMMARIAFRYPLKMMLDADDGFSTKNTKLWVKRFEV
jgi:hypothetical protein